MIDSHALIIIRGGGDLATGVAYRLHKAGFPILVLELPRPLVVRRRVALATAALEGEVTVEELRGRLVHDPAEALRLAETSPQTAVIPVLISPEIPNLHSPISILIDARMAKRNVDTRLDQAPLVIGLGPGFTAGRDCHAVIETMRGHRLGRVIWEGSALPNTGTPGLVAGKGAERVLRAPVAGKVDWRLAIGDWVQSGAEIGSVGGEPVVAPFAGVLRGLIAPGTDVPAGLKIGDLDARADVSACFTISDKALAIGGGVLEAVLFWLKPPSLASPSLLPVTLSPPHLVTLSPSLSLAAAFNIQANKEVVALVGGGGKSTLLFALGRSLPGRVVLTTTTRLAAHQLEQSPAVCLIGAAATADAEIPEVAEVAAHLARFGACLVAGDVQGEKVLGVPETLPARLAARPDVDFVVVEADGARMRPCKAPAGHEPAIPPGTTLVVSLVGIDALGRRVADVVHRPERFQTLTGLGPGDAVTPEALAALLTHPEGGLKRVPPAARLIPFINKVETVEQLAAAHQIARLVLREPRIEQVVIGAAATARPVGEILRRVTAVVLAAGSGSRMGQTKQLLPWGDTTLLGRTLRNLQETAVHDILVVSGHEAEAVEAVAAAHGVATIHNERYAAGEMLSSLQKAARHLPANCAAVLVVLADQPMVEPETVDRLLEAYWQGYGELIAPVFQERRGNPVLIGRRYFGELLALPAGAAPRDLLQRHAADLHLVEVTTDAILRDLDRPEDYERWRPEPVGGKQ